MGESYVMSGVLEYDLYSTLLAANTQQVIIWANFDPVFCYHMASLKHGIFTFSFILGGFFNFLSEYNIPFPSMVYTIAADELRAQRAKSSPTTA